MERQIDEVSKTVADIGLMLSGREPSIQGAILTDLVAMFLAGHHPALRKSQLDLMIETINRLVPVNERILFGDNYPEGWKTQ